MTIAENLDRIETAKEAIKDAIVSKGGQVAEDARIDEYPAAIEALPSGGIGNAENYLRYTNLTNFSIKNNGHFINGWYRVNNTEWVEIGENFNIDLKFSDIFEIRFSALSITNVSNINFVNITNSANATVEGDIYILTHKMLYGWDGLTKDNFKDVNVNIHYYRDISFGIGEGGLLYESNLYIKKDVLKLERALESVTDSQNKNVSVHIVGDNEIDKIGKRCFYRAFINNKNLKYPILLPEHTIVSDSAFYNCYTGCTSLIEAPALPATSLQSSCYRSMFARCTSLIEAPALPARVIGSQCYYELFSGCTALQKTGEIAATGNISSNASSMFYGCTSLKEMTWTSTTPPTINSNIWTNCPSDMIIYVPDEAVEAYKAASVWSSRAAYIKGISEKPTE